MTVIKEPPKVLTPDDLEKKRLADERKLKNYYEYEDRLKKKQAEIDESKAERSICNTAVTRLQKELIAIISAGPNGNTPLIDLAEEKEHSDPDAWKKKSVDQLDMQESIKKKTKEHGFRTLGDLAAWVNLDFPPKKKGLSGEKTLEQIREAFIKYHDAHKPKQQLPADPTKEQQPVVSPGNESKAEKTIPKNDVHWMEYLALIDDMSECGSYDFAEDTLDEIYQWVKENQHITPKQIEAIDNIRIDVKYPIDGIELERVPKEKKTVRSGKKYLLKSQGMDDRVIFVDQGLINGKPPKWGTFWQSTINTLARLQSKSLPMVDTAEQAQIDLNNYAAKHKLKEVN